MKILNYGLKFLMWNIFIIFSIRCKKLHKRWKSLWRLLLTGGLSESLRLFFLLYITYAYEFFNILFLNQVIPSADELLNGVQQLTGKFLVPARCLEKSYADLLRSFPWFKPIFRRWAWQAWWFLNLHYTKTESLEPQLPCYTKL